MARAARSSTYSWPDSFGRISRKPGDGRQPAAAPESAARRRHAAATPPTTVASARRDLQRRSRRSSAAFQLDVQAQLVGGIGIMNRLLVPDGALVVEVEQRCIEGHHAELARFLHDALDLVKFALEELVGDGRRIDQYLDGRPPSLAVPGADQALRDDRP